MDWSTISLGLIWINPNTETKNKNNPTKMEVR